MASLRSVGDRANTGTLRRRQDAVADEDIRARAATEVRDRKPLSRGLGSRSYVWIGYGKSYTIHPEIGAVVFWTDRSIVKLPAKPGPAGAQYWDETLARPDVPPVGH